MKKQIKFGSDVAPTQPYDPLPKSVQPCHLVGKSSSNSLPSHVVEDVIHVAIDHDSDVLAGAINSQDHLIPVSFFLFYFVFFFIIAFEFVYCICLFFIFFRVKLLCKLYLFLMMNLLI